MSLIRHYGDRPTREAPACQNCGGPRRDRDHSRRRFCSRACAAAAHTIRQTSRCSVCGDPVTFRATTCMRHNHTPARQARLRPCAHCGTPFAPYPSAMARGLGKFCSRDCYTANRPPAFVESTCSNPACGETFARRSALVKRSKRPTCSRECAAVIGLTDGGSQWRGGGSKGYRGKNWQEVRRQVRERDGYRCRRCGKTEEENGQQMSVDHVEPWRTFDSYLDANGLTNLVSLCSVCHGVKTATVERKYVQRGDALGMATFRRSVGL